MDFDAVSPTTRGDQIPKGFLTKMDSLSKLHLLGKSNNTSSTEGTADDFEETSELSAANWAKTNIVEQHSPPKQQPDDVDTSELSVAPNWAPTKRVADHNSESSEEGVEDSPYIPRPPPAVDPPSVAFDDVVNEEDEISMSEMSEMMIRVNTATDLAAENPFAFFSPPRDVDSRSQAPLQEQQPRQPEHQPSQPSPAKESPSRKTREDFAKDSPSKKYVPSASLRVQHNDAWLRQFILPLPHDEQKLKQLEAVGTSSRNLTPDKHDKEIATMRYNVENTMMAVQALEQQLEQDLAAAKPTLPEAEFLKLMNRCLNLRKAALIACLQAVNRSNEAK